MKQLMESVYTWLRAKSYLKMIIIIETRYEDLISDRMCAVELMCVYSCICVCFSVKIRDGF